MGKDGLGLVQALQPSNAVCGPAVIRLLYALRVGAADTFNRHVQQQHSKKKYSSHCAHRSRHNRSHGVQHSRCRCLSRQAPGERHRKVRLFKNTGKHVMAIL